MKRLAIVSTHPIQYNAPFFKLLTQRNRVKVKVFYTWGTAVLRDKFDPGFGKIINWDIPVLDGYEYSFVDNVAVQPGSHHFKGIDNPSLTGEIQKFGADAVLVYGWSFKSHLHCLRFFHNKIPVLFRGDSTLLDPQPALKKIFRKVFLRWVYKHVDHALYVGTNNREYFKQCGIPESRLCFAPHAIDNERFSSDDPGFHQQAMQWRRELSFAASDTVFLFAGKLEEKKDPLLLVKTFLSIQQPGIKLLIAGNGPLEAMLKQSAKGCDSIRFTGFQNQTAMPVLYRLADCFVLPSKGPGETWGLAVNEAMACSRPVIAGDKCGCAIDLITNNETGYIFSSGNADSLAEAMKAFINNTNKAAMNTAAREKIESWNFTEICKQVETILS